ncbi:hypothetical protein [Legionella moravica]|nr:hypothetical protein [Legionella moravica]
MAGFTKKYNVDRLVYYEACESIVVVIERENKLKIDHEKRSLI